MAVLSDIGHARNIHPQNKQDVGDRLALWALAKDYDKKDLVYSGPIFKSAKVEGSTMVISFDHVGSGLMVGKKDGLKPTEEIPGGELKGFAIQGADGSWQWADAKIVGQTVVVSAEKVSKPKAVRFGFTTNRAHCNFYNKEGLPAVPFRAGEVPKRDWLTLKVAEAKQYKLIYDLDLANLGQNIKYTVDAGKDFTGDFDRIAYFLELKKFG